MATRMHQQINVFSRICLRSDQGFGIILALLGRFWIPFWRPLDFEGVSQIDNFHIKSTLKKKRAQGGV